MLDAGARFLRRPTPSSVMRDGAEDISYTGEAKAS